MYVHDTWRHCRIVALAVFAFNVASLNAGTWVLDCGTSYGSYPERLWFNCYDDDYVRLQAGGVAGFESMQVGSMATRMQFDRPQRGDIRPVSPFKIAVVFPRRKNRPFVRKRQSRKRIEPA